MCGQIWSWFLDFLRVSLRRPEGTASPRSQLAPGYGPRLHCAAKLHCLLFLYGAVSGLRLYPEQTTDLTNLPELSSGFSTLQPLRTELTVETSQLSL